MLHTNTKELQATSVKITHVKNTLVFKCIQMELVISSHVLHLADI